MYVGLTWYNKSIFEKYHFLVHFINLHFVPFALFTFQAEVVRMRSVHIHVVLQRYRFYTNTVVRQTSLLGALCVNISLGVYTLKHKCQNIPSIFMVKLYSEVIFPNISCTFIIIEEIKTHMHVCTHTDRHILEKQIYKKRKRSDNYLTMLILCTDLTAETK